MNHVVLSRAWPERVAKFQGNYVHRVFAYGTLINRRSRRKTGASGEALPVRLRGWQRAWNKRVESSFMTVLGVRRQAGATCNGVVFSVEDADLESFDAREAGYRREPITGSDLAPIGDHAPRIEGAWVYVPEDPCSPTQEFPIAQSYLDVCLGGCLDFGREFALEFVRTTEGWDGPRIDDRSAPRYSRADTTVSTEGVDSILSLCGY